MAGTVRRRRRRQTPDRKMQTAVEYLTTYGWAVLLIAVVIVALFYLGIFNTSNFVPKVQPGSCYVYRPHGPGTVQNMVLDGVCSGVLPEFVFDTSTNQVNVTVVKFAPTLTSAGQNSMTLTAWAAPEGCVTKCGDSYLLAYISTYGTTSTTYYPSIYTAMLVPGGWKQQTAFLETGVWYNGGVTINDQSQMFNLNPSISQGLMNFYAFAYNGNTLTQYYILNGYVQTYTIPISLGTNVIQQDGTLQIGQAVGGEPDWNGLISNVQVYNTTLTQNDIIQLYEEGIGGAPINLQHLIGWWPLNGNLNDYSGNGDNGTPTVGKGKLSYINNWENTYIGH